MKINNPVVYQRLIQLNRLITEAIKENNFQEAKNLRIEKQELLKNKYIKK